MGLSLSVLVCVHSNDDFYDNLLIKSLQSLEKQSYKNFETILVLDNCWKQTKQKLESKKFNLKMFIYEKETRRGLHDAKNFGLSHIKSDLVAFLDADDLYCENKLEKQIDFFNKNIVDFLGTQAWNITDDEKNLSDSCFKLGQYETHSEISSNIEKFNMLTHGSMMIRKKCLDELGGYHEDKGKEDWDLWKRAIKQGYKFHQLQERLYIYRLNTSTVR